VIDLEGKVALVTGASRGVGAATAVALAEAGCDVACAARSTESAPQRTPGTIDETVARVAATGRRAVAVPTNLAVDDEAALLFVDFATGATLHVSGTAHVEWTAPGAVGDDGGVGRRVVFSVDSVVATEEPRVLRGSAGDLQPR